MEKHDTVLYDTVRYWKMNFAQSFGWKEEIKKIQQKKKKKKKKKGTPIFFG